MAINYTTKLNSDGNPEYGYYNEDNRWIKTDQATAMGYNLDDLGYNPLNFGGSGLNSMVNPDGTNNVLLIIEDPEQFDGRMRHLLRPAPDGSGRYVIPSNVYMEEGNKLGYNMGSTDFMTTFGPMAAMTAMGLAAGGAFGDLAAAPEATATGFTAPADSYWSMNAGVGDTTVHSSFFETLTEPVSGMDLAADAGNLYTGNGAMSGGAWDAAGNAITGPNLLNTAGQVLDQGSEEITDQVAEQVTNPTYPQGGDPTDVGMPGDVTNVPTFPGGSTDVDIWKKAYEGIVNKLSDPFTLLQTIWGIKGSGDAKKDAEELQRNILNQLGLSNPFGPGREAALKQYLEYRDNPSAWANSPFAQMQLDELGRQFRAKNAQQGMTFNVNPDGNITGSGQGATDFTRGIQTNLAGLYSNEMNSLAQQAGMSLFPNPGFASAASGVQNQINQANRDQQGGYGMLIGAGRELFPEIGKEWANKVRSIFGIGA